MVATVDALHAVRERWHPRSVQLAAAPFAPCCQCEANRDMQFAQQSVRRCSNTANEEFIFVEMFLPFLRRHHSAGQNQPRTFIELGGNNGLSGSNTLYLEHCLGWRGIMLEGHTAQHAKLAANRPAVLTIGSAVCAAGQSVVKYGTPSAGRRQPSDRPTVTSQMLSDVAAAAQPHVSVPCAPLQSYLTPLGVSYTDLLSLDVEGSELVVLESLDWSKFSAATLIVEELRVEGVGLGWPKVRELLARRGYEHALSTCFRNFPTICDNYYVLPDRYDMEGLKARLGWQRWGNFTGWEVLGERHQQKCLK